MNPKYTLSDETIALIVKIIQFGFLTGSDVTDHFRTMKLTIGENYEELVPEENWYKTFEKYIVETNELLVKEIEASMVEEFTQKNLLPN
jgi:hypothetical protein